MSIDFNPQLIADTHIAQRALTNSKRPSALLEGLYPTHIASGYGCHMRDAAGRKYIDFICGLGVNLLGYAHNEISGAIMTQIQKGVIYSIPSILEVDAVEHLKSVIPFIQKVKFLKTGSEACTASVKIARAHTGRKKVLSDGYHGWHDGFSSLSESGNHAISVVHYCSDGINQLRDISQIDESTACVIIEPVITKIDDNHVRAIRDRCKQVGALLIFDEIITGFRFPKYCYAQYADIYPDILLLGKAIGGGLPVAVVAGSAEIMDNPNYFVSSTFAGDTLALAAMIQVIKLLSSQYKLEELWERGSVFLNSTNELLKTIDLEIEGYPTRGRFIGDEKQIATFWQECARAGILFGPSYFYNFHHTKVTDTVLSHVKDIVSKIARHEVTLMYPLPKKPLAIQTARYSKGE